tara:strand:- start:586 stop:972 length:387 start_codon:yes stop_codon:yes gene_type:complete
MATTNRQPMERYAAKTEDNTAEVVLPGITVLVGDKGVVAENGFFYKIVALGTSELVVNPAPGMTPSDSWEVLGVTGASGPTSTGMGAYPTNIRLSAQDEILGKFKRIDPKTGSYLVAYAKAGTRVKAA